MITLFDISTSYSVFPIAFRLFTSIPLQVTEMVELVTFPAEFLILIPKSPPAKSEFWTRINVCEAQIADLPPSLFPQPLFVDWKVASWKIIGEIGVPPP